MIIVLVRLRDLEWGYHWDQKLELREVTLVGYQEGTVMENLRYDDWEKHWYN